MTTDEAGNVTWFSFWLFMITEHGKGQSIEPFFSCVNKALILKTQAGLKAAAFDPARNNSSFFWQRILAPDSVVLSLITAFHTWLPTEVIAQWRSRTDKTNRTASSAKITHFIVEASKWMIQPFDLLQNFPIKATYKKKCTKNNLTEDQQPLKMIKKNCNVCSKPRMRERSLESHSELCVKSTLTELTLYCNHW